MAEIGPFLVELNDINLSVILLVGLSGNNKSLKHNAWLGGI